MSREDYERWAREWDDARGTKSGEMPVGSLLTQFKLLTVDGRGVHFFRPVWPGDVDERPRLGTMAAYMTNFTDLTVLPTTGVGPDAWTEARDLNEYCRAVWTERHPTAATSGPPSSATGTSPAASS